MAEIRDSPRPVYQKIIDEIQTRGLEYVAADDELGGGYFFSPDDFLGTATCYIERPAIQKLAHLAGFVFLPEKISSIQPTAAAVGIPDPPRFANAVQSLHIPVQFIPEAVEDKERETPAELYLQSYKQGIYPVGVDNINTYVHDVSDDHFLAVALGGLRMRRYLQREADVDPGNDNLVIKRADNIDSATDLLSEAILWMILNPKLEDIPMGFEAAAYRIAHGSSTPITSEFLQEFYTRRLKRLGII